MFFGKFIARYEKQLLILRNIGLEETLMHNFHAKYLGVKEDKIFNFNPSIIDFC